MRSVALISCKWLPSDEGMEIYCAELAGELSNRCRLDVIAQELGEEEAPVRVAIRTLAGRSEHAYPVHIAEARY